MIYASKRLEGVEQVNPPNHILFDFRKDTSKPGDFLNLAFWNDLFIYEDEIARRRHAFKVIRLWARVCLNDEGVEFLERT